MKDWKRFKRYCFCLPRKDYEMVTETGEEVFISDEGVMVEDILWGEYFSWMDVEEAILTKSEKENDLWAGDSWVVYTDKKEFKFKTVKRNRTRIKYSHEERKCF